LIQRRHEFECQCKAARVSFRGGTSFTQRRHEFHLEAARVSFRAARVSFRGGTSDTRRQHEFHCEAARVSFRGGTSFTEREAARV
jgi:hypothetical protein